jgi:hypothetical protein
MFDLLYFTSDAPIGDCTGSLTRAHCEIRPAALDVDFAFSDFSQVSAGLPSTSRLDIGVGTSAQVAAWNEQGTQIQPYHIKQLLPIAEDGSPGDTKLGGVYLTLQQTMGSSANLTYNTTTQQWELQQTGTFALQQAAAGYAGDVTPGTCNYNYFSGTVNDVVYDINRLGLALMTNPLIQGDGATQDTPVSQIGFGIHYRTNYAFMAGAVASMILCALLVFPTYWGFWQLGRPVSLAPVEIANAFRAPVLENPKASNGVVDDLLKEVGSRRVMFGEMPEGRLAVEEVGKVRRVGTAPT